MGIFGRLLRAIEFVVEDIPDEISYRATNLLEKTGKVAGDVAYTALSIPLYPLDKHVENLENKRTKIIQRANEEYEAKKDNELAAKIREAERLPEDEFRSRIEKYMGTFQFSSELGSVNFNKVASQMVERGGMDAFILIREYQRRYSPRPKKDGDYPEERGVRAAWGGNNYWVG